MHAHPLRITPVGSLLGSLGLLLLATACGEDDAQLVQTDTPSAQPGMNRGGSSGSSQTATSNGGMGGSSGMSGTTMETVEGNGGSNGLTNNAGSGNTPPPPVVGPEVSVTGEITEDTTWTADKVYLLEGMSPVFVVNDATLTIEAGTVIKGAGLGTALVVTRGSKLVANGTKEAPVVFTSGVTPGLRNSGDWGGVVLLGSAPINAAAGAIEGIASGDMRGVYGGSAPNEGDAVSSCGSLKYVRIEFAGFQYSVDNELNGLTLGGCGSSTVIDYVQVHRGFDDGIEVFGGTVDIKHAVITGSADDALDWDRGWTGRGQFIIIRTDPMASDSAIEADNNNSNNSAVPRSNPTLYNLTIVGDQGSRAAPGVVLRRGTFASIRDAIVMGFPVSGLDIRDTDGVNGAMGGSLVVSNSIFFQNGVGGTVHGDVANDGTTGMPPMPVLDALDEGAWLATQANQLGVDPLLPDAYNVTAPNFMPPATSPASLGAVAAPMTDFFVPANYVGALPPGGEDWTAGWTSYPVR